jgi:hypothetical protein
MGCRNASARNSIKVTLAYAVELLTWTEPLRGIRIGFVRPVLSYPACFIELHARMTSYCLRILWHSRMTAVMHPAFVRVIGVGARHRKVMATIDLTQSERYARLLT